ncbi:hypothetical protein SDJN03_15800, partial [Cucurbita argyrosperma subsp. sororia]
MCISPVKDDCSRRGGPPASHLPSNGLGPTNRERIRIWPLSSSKCISSPGWSTVRQTRHRLGAIDGTWKPIFRNTISIDTRIKGH